MRNKSFVVFILTHGRAGNVKTLRTLRKCGYTGKIILVLDSEDCLIEDYRRIYGNQNIVVFDKSDISKKFDQMDNFAERRTVFYARNVCYDIAEKLGYEYFLELDDDYNSFEKRIRKGDKLLVKQCNKLDGIFDSMIEYLEMSGAHSIAFMQGGDLIGGKQNINIKNRISRKCMNTFFCKTKRRVKFSGRINEDVNTYCLEGSRGQLFLSVVDVCITQEQTQKQDGGMSGQYLESGTYLKSFYTVMCCPSCVKIGIMGDKQKRIHHTIKWNNCIPKIVSERYKKT